MTLTCRSCTHSAWAPTRLGIKCTVPHMRPFKVCERFSYEPGSGEFDDVQVRQASMGVRDNGVPVLHRETASGDADTDRALFAGAD
jgi:hypothetical protein